MPQPQSLPRYTRNAIRHISISHPLDVVCRFPLHFRSYLFILRCVAFGFAPFSSGRCLPKPLSYFLSPDMSIRFFGDVSSVAKLACSFAPMFLSLFVGKIPSHYGASEVRPVSPVSVCPILSLLCRMTLSLVRRRTSIRRIRSRTGLHFSHCDSSLFLSSWPPGLVNSPPQVSRTMILDCPRR